MPTIHPRRLAASLLLGSLLFAADDPYRSAIEKDRHETDAMLRSAHSPLLLVGRFSVREGDSTLGSDPASNIVLPSRAPQHLGTLSRHGTNFSFQPAPGASVTLNDKPVTGIVPLQVAESTKPNDHIAFGDFRFGIRPVGDDYSLLLTDSQSLYLKNFNGTVWFAIDPAYRITARFQPAAERKTIMVPFTDGGEKSYVISGDLSFELAGQGLHLLALASTDSKGLFILFQDQTSGKETYGGGRHLETKLPKDGKVVLDFNKASNLYCAYDPYAICPRPLKQNRLPVAIRAGEKSAH